MTPHSGFSKAKGKDLRRTIPLSIALEPRGELQLRSVIESHRRKRVDARCEAGTDGVGILGYVTIDIARGQGADTCKERPKHHNYGEK
jgi:hypothetical protein